MQVLMCRCCCLCCAVLPLLWCLLAAASAAGDHHFYCPGALMPDHEDTITAEQLPQGRQSAFDCAQGQRCSDGAWFDLAAMSQQPLQQRFKASDAAGGRLSARVVMDTAYHGGSCLHISGLSAPPCRIIWTQCLQPQPETPTKFKEFQGHASRPSTPVSRCTIACLWLQMMA